LPSQKASDARKKNYAESPLVSFFIFLSLLAIQGVPPSPPYRHSGRRVAAIRNPVWFFFFSSSSRNAHTPIIPSSSSPPFRHPGKFAFCSLQNANLSGIPFGFFFSSLAFPVIQGALPSPLLVIPGRDNASALS
jgi:hypothetical protein